MRRMAVIAHAKQRAPIAKRKGRLTYSQPVQSIDPKAASGISITKSTSARMLRIARYHGGDINHLCCFAKWASGINASLSIFAIRDSRRFAGGRKSGALMRLD